MRFDQEVTPVHVEQSHHPFRPRRHVHGWRSLMVLTLVATMSAPALGQSGYSVGPQDVLAITVWGQPDLSGRFPVGGDGIVVFPLAGRITAGGRTVEAIQDELTGRLRDRFVKNPQVTVAVDQFRSQQIFVVGEVQRAGTYPLTGSMTLLEALAHAGSTSARAGTQVLIVRQRPRSNSTEPIHPGDAVPNEVLRVELEQLSRGDLTQNAVLQAGDTVLVPRGETAFVLGQVHNPGEYAVRPKGTTVLQILALAGGVTDQGSMRRIRIVRRDGSSKREVKATLDDTVTPGDTVIVSERVF
jgi:polysaccharide biosynthesis/export protein